MLYNCIQQQPQLYIILSIFLYNPHGQTENINKQECFNNKEYINYLIRCIADSNSDSYLGVCCTYHVDEEKNN